LFERGQTILIENLGETIDAVFAPVISRSVIKRGRQKYLKLGDKELNLHEKFKLILHTKFANPR
jgi:dynein heavy chain